MGDTPSKVPRVIPGSGVTSISFCELWQVLRYWLDLLWAETARNWPVFAVVALGLWVQRCGLLSCDVLLERPAPAQRNGALDFKPS